MHQTFYIDVDEEISSVIDKLRKSLAVENYFVVTKRALVVQSIVNLKLLKREAEKIKKGIVIVTADEQTMKMAERAGIKAQASMEGLDFVEDESTESDVVEIPVEPDFAKQKKKRLVGVGSSDYYGGSAGQVIVVNEEQEEEELAESSDSSIAEPETPRKPVRRMDDFKKNTDSLERSSSDGIRKPQVKVPPRAVKRTEGINYDLKESFEAFLDPEKEKKFDRIFHNQPQKIVPQEKRMEPANEGGGGKNFIFAFVLMALLFFAGAAAYLFVPSADVVVYLDTENKNVSSSITADAGQQAVDVENLKIPARLIEKESEITLSSEATGVSESAGQKAKGTLVVYNEYSASPQPLIATTRFETEDGKIFRLVRDISVPGMSNVGGKTSPGAIEVEVVADMSGESYNIEPSSFTVPGLKGTDKYNKVYAKSSKAMAGGGVLGDAAKIVSQSDMDEAKRKTEESIKEKIGELIKGELGEGEVIVSQASKIDITDSIPYAQVGDLKSSFDYQVRAKLTAFVVQEKDIKEISSKSYRESSKKPYEYAIDDVAFEFESAEPDFENKKVLLKVGSQVSARPVFDSEGFKKKLAAKDENQIREVMKGFPQVRNLEISVRPDFLSTTPRFDSRISLEVKDFQGR
ncbi:MAG: hypothetical protein UW87_C0006G0005 [Candidatus Moranbacteria bacterium GW2011_GWC2_45_10]|nr:MAG: hypothetical protein UW87_C0006G0005 [Candidatus Moranbacteria bacterium GW2011_GWC2_45_10]